MSQQRIHKNQEDFVVGDWLATLPMLTDTFAALLSDLTSGNIPYGERRRFYLLVAAALRHGGLFIDKNLTNANGLLPIGAIKRKYRDAPPNLQIANYFSCEAIFCSELLLEQGVLDTSYVYGRLTELLEGARFARLISAAQLITPRQCFWYYGRPWEQLAEDYCPTMSLHRKYVLARSQPYWRRAYQYVWIREA